MASGQRVPDLWRTAPTQAQTGAVTVDGFYEDDEPVADVVAAFDRAPKGLTAPPVPADGEPERD